MPRDYELMYIVRPDLEDEAVTAAMASVQTIIEAEGGEVVTTTPWGKRRLAYEIERLRDGHYVLLHIRLEADKVRELERLLAIHDTVFRHLLTVYVEDGTAEGAATRGVDDDPGDRGDRGDRGEGRRRSRDDDQDSGPRRPAPVAARRDDIAVAPPVAAAPAVEEPAVTQSPAAGAGDHDHEPVGDHAVAADTEDE